MSTQSIPVGQLLLDVENPRHGRVQSQQEAILTLLDMKLVKLAEHIAANGVSPIDACLVVKKGPNYVVREGNRRLAAVKLLHNPKLAEGTQYAKHFARIAKTANAIPDELECAVAGSREEADLWVELRHTGESGGAGTIRWGALETVRFKNRPGSQSGKAMAFVDTMSTAFPKNAGLQANLQKVATERLTTLGRLVADPEFRKRFGLEERDGRFLSHFPAEVLEDPVEQLAGDVALTLSVTNIKTKGQRTKYLNTLATPAEDARRDEAQPLALGTGPLARKRPRRPKAARPGPVFKTLSFKHLGGRVAAVLDELRKLDLDRYPNAAAILCRVLLELAVDRVYEKKGKSWVYERELFKRVGKCLSDIDSTGKDKTYQAVRTGLADGSSVYAVSTLNAFVHNPHFHPSATEVRAFAANYERFLAELDARA